MIKQFNQKFFTKYSLMYLILTLGLATVGMIGYSLQSTSALNNASWIRKKATTQSSRLLVDELDDDKKYTNYFIKISDNPNGEDITGWNENLSAPLFYPKVTSSITLIDLFKNEKIASAVYSAIRTENSSYPTTGVNTIVTKNDLATVKNLDLSNNDLTEINYVLYNEDIVWSNLRSINLDNNNFGKYQLVFNKTNMPKLWKISARNNNLQYMINVASYVLDPYDQTKEGTAERTAAEAQYDSPIMDNVPRYFDVANNKIRFIPKYYLKIALGYLDISVNQLGKGSDSDPMGYYALPSYTAKTRIATENNNLAIPDPEIRGPYGINIYNSGNKKEDGEYLYSDEKVGRWRAQPFPIKFLRFYSFNPTPDVNGNFDSSIPKISKTLVSAKDKYAPFFDFGDNNLNNIPIFFDSVSNYNRLSSTKPQNKSTSIYVGLEDWKKSNIYKDTTKQDRYPKFKEISAFDTDSSYSPFFDYSNLDFNYDARVQNKYNVTRSLAASARSFNGYDMFMINEDSRPISSTTDKTLWQNWYQASGYNESNDNPNLIYNSKNTSKIKNKSNLNNGGVTWDPYYLSRNDSGVITSDIESNRKWKFQRDNFWGSPILENDDGGYAKFLNFKYLNVMARTGFLRSFVNTNISYTKGFNFDGSGKLIDQLLFENTPGAHLFYDYQTARKNLIAVFSPTNYVSSPSPKLNYEYELTSYINSNRSQWTGPSIFGQSTPVFHRKNSFISNLENDSSFGISVKQSTPYISQFRKTSGGLGGYQYNTNYVTVDSISSNFNNDDLSGIFVENINTSLKTDGISIIKKYESTSGTTPVTQAVTSIDLKEGRNLFWNASNQFDSQFMETIDPHDIELSSNDEEGELIFKFRIYSPGYTTLGRLIRSDDNDPDSTRTLDFWTFRKVKGFAPVALWQKISESEDKLISAKNKKESIVLQIPDDWKNKPVHTITNKEIADQFKTTFLGNMLSKKITLGLTELEKKQGQKQILFDDWVTITRFNANDAKIEFKLNIPDYQFSNGNIMKFPDSLKDTTFVFEGFQKQEIDYVGSETKPFKQSSFTDESVYNNLVKKAASEISALELFQANIIESNRTDWLALKDNSSKASEIFTNLISNNVSGTLSFLIRLPGNSLLGLDPFIKQVFWNGFLNNTTQGEWITQENLTKKFPGLNPQKLKEKFIENPLDFLNFKNPYENKNVVKDDIYISETNIFINTDTGDLQLNGIFLKKFKRNGIDENFSSTLASGVVNTNDFLQIQSSPNYKGILPPSSAVWIAADEAKNNLLDFFVEKQLIRENTNVTPSISVDSIKNDLTPAEAKIMLLQSRISFDSLFKTFVNLNIRNIQFKNENLTDSVTADDITGTLKIHDVSFKEWRNDSGDFVTHKLTEDLIIDFNKLTTNHLWAEQLPLEVRFLPPKTLLDTFASEKLASEFVAKLDFGKKTYNNNGELITKYSVDLSKVSLNTYSGILKFNKGAVSISPNYKNSIQEADSILSIEKTYDLTSSSATRSSINTEVSIKSPNEYKNEYIKFANFNTNYDSASPEEKALFDNQFEKLKATNLNGLNVPQAIKQLKTWEIVNKKTTLTESDLEKINELKTKNPAVSSTNFTNYKYAPEFMFFITGPNVADNDSERTFVIAESYEKSSAQDNVLIFKNVYVINDYQNKIPGIKLIGGNINFYNFNQTSSLTFKHDETDSKYGLVPSQWKNLSAKDVVENLRFLNQYRLMKDRIDDPIKSQFESKQKIWLEMIDFELIPANGRNDLTIAYVDGIEFDQYQRQFRVNKLWFPNFFENNGRGGVVNVQKEILYSDVFKVSGGSDNSSIVNVMNKSSPDIAKKSIEELLLAWGIKEGNQSDSEDTFNKLKNNNIIKILGGNPDLLLSNPQYTGVGYVGKVEINRSGKNLELKLSNVKIKNGWFDGKQETSEKSIADVSVEFDLITSSVTQKTTGLRGAISNIYANKWYPDPKDQSVFLEPVEPFTISVALKQWKDDIESEETTGMSTMEKDKVSNRQKRALALINQMFNINGIYYENGIQKTTLAFNSPVSKLDSPPPIFPSNAVDISSSAEEIVIKINGLQLYKGYKDSQIEDIPQENFTLSITNDYTTPFEEVEARAEINSIFNSNNLKNSSSSTIKNYFANKDNQNTILKTIYQSNRLFKNDLEKLMYPKFLLILMIY